MQKEKEEQREREESGEREGVLPTDAPNNGKAGKKGNTLQSSF